ncbi:ABC transporter substrate-binding protein [Aliamphritea hakodatensis]|uniref:ABC transporter substrate-binding protein n=1 Tax=Aliamphritea hakodatensis TaxID=2895352 RepID=UPI0022FD46C8|nr:extracellular solute-binding protein [Aliamphritea hakodatensis]
MLFTTFSTASAADTLTLRMLTWQGYAPVSQADRFRELILKKYGVPLNIEIAYVDSSDDFFDAIRAGRVDIIAPSHSVFNDSRYKFLDRQLLIPINLDNVPNYAGLMPRLKAIRYADASEDVFFVPLTFGPYGLAYNQQQLPNAPGSWKSLWQPEYAGRYTVNSDYYEANIYIAALASGMSIGDINNVDKLNTPELRQMLTALVKNASQLWGGVDQASDLSGHTLATSWGFSFPALRQRGEQWKMACPREGTTVWIDGYALSKTLQDRPQHKRIAEEWINFTLSKAFQTRAIYQQLNSFPASEAVYRALKNAGTLPHDEACINFDFKWPELNSRERNFMKSIWQRALQQAKTPANSS